MWMWRVLTISLNKIYPCGPHTVASFLPSTTTMGGTFWRHTKISIRFYFWAVDFFLLDRTATKPTTKPYKKSRFLESSDPRTGSCVLLKFFELFLLLFYGFPPREPEISWSNLQRCSLFHFLLFVLLDPLYLRIPALKLVDKSMILNRFSLFVFAWLISQWLRGKRKIAISILFWVWRRSARRRNWGMPTRNSLWLDMSPFTTPCFLSSFVICSYDFGCSNRVMRGRLILPKKIRCLNFWVFRENLKTFVLLYKGFFFWFVSILFLFEN